MDDCLQMLICAADERGLDAKDLIDTTTNRGETPLQLAAMNGWNDCVSILLERGADIWNKNIDGFNAFISAAEYGHIEIVKTIYDHTTSIIYERNERVKGWTALHLAARNGHRFIVDFLHEKGGDKLLQMDRDDGRTPLMSVVLTGDTGYEDKGFVNAVSTKSDTRVRGKAELKLDAIMSSMWERGKIALSLISWCPEMLTKLDNLGRSCLHIAADQDQERMLELLVLKICENHGATKAAEMLRMQDKSLMNCMQSSCVKKGNHVLSYLTDTASYMRTGFFNEEEAEALCRELLLATSLNGRTCLHLAAGFGRRKIVVCLLETLKRYDMLELVRKKTNDGRTAAHSAANFGHLDALQSIANCGEIGLDACLAQDNDGWTALHWIADSVGGAATFANPVSSSKTDSLMENTKKQGSAVDMTAFLCGLQNGTDPKHILFQIDKSGRSALHIASRFGSEDLVHAILQEAKKVNGAEKLLKMARTNGMLAMHGAAHLGRSNIVETLYRFSGEGVGSEMVMAADEFGWIPVFWSLAGLQKQYAPAGKDGSRDHKQAAVLLRSYGGSAGVEWADCSGITALHLACATDDMELVSLFLEEADPPREELSAKDEVVAAAVKESDEQRARVERLTTKKSERVAWVEQGMSVLHFAAFSGATTVFEKLFADYQLDASVRDVSPAFEELACSKRACGSLCNMPAPSLRLTALCSPGDGPERFALCVCIE